MSYFSNTLLRVSKDGSEVYQFTSGLLKVTGLQ
jgi:hypothetical protein